MFFCFVSCFVIGDVLIWFVLCLRGLLVVVFILVMEILFNLLVLLIVVKFMFVWMVRCVVIGLILRLFFEMNVCIVLDDMEEVWGVVCVGVVLLEVGIVEL